MLSLVHFPTGLLCLLTAVAGQWQAGVDIGYRFEPGVENRLLLEGSATRPVSSRLTLTGYLSAALPGLDNPGLARYGVAASVRLAQPAELGLELGLAHEQWPDWTAGENRATLLVTARPLAPLALGVGAAWRVPLHGADYHSPLVWCGDSPELNLAYRLDWRFLSRDRFSAAAYVANCDGSMFRNPQQVPFGLTLDYRPAAHTTLTARVGSGIKGMSSILFSLAELDAHLGVTRDF